MSIAVDQMRLRRIVQGLLPRRSLERTEAGLILQFVQLAAGADHKDDLSEHATMQSIAQQLGVLSGIAPGDVSPIRPLEEEAARVHWLHTLGANLYGTDVRELTYAFAFLVSVADLELDARERTLLEEIQRALRLDDRRAMDIVVFLTEIVAASAQAAS